jgi:hypothetical protein
MARKVEIEIEISPTGEVSLDVNGTKGKMCTDLTKAFEDELGRVVERKLKPAYHQVAQSTVSRKIK